MESQSTTEGAIQKKDAYVEIWASWSTLNYVKAEIISLSEFGTSLMFAETFVQHMDMSSHPSINLRIQKQDTKTLNTIKGIVNNVRGAKGFVTLSIEYLNDQGAQTRLPAKTFSTFNRRATSRAILPSNPRTEVNITNTSTNQSLTAALMDISEGGLRLLFFNAPDCPAGADRLKIDFMLPNSEYKFSLIARVIKMFSLAGVKSCGIQFSTVGEDYKIQQLEIRKYVKGRLAELTEVALLDFTD